MFSIYDCKAEAYMAPQCFHTKGQCIRAFAELANDKSTNVGKYPEDFTLFEVGEYDDSNCGFNLLPTPNSLGKALEFIKSDER